MACPKGMDNRTYIGKLEDDNRTLIAHIQHLINYNDRIENDMKAIFFAAAGMHEDLDKALIRIRGDKSRMKKLARICEISVPFCEELEDMKGLPQEVIDQRDRFLAALKEKMAKRKAAEDGKGDDTQDRGSGEGGGRRDDAADDQHEDGETR